METSVYKIHGSHRTEQEIERVLGRNPDIHSGFAGKGAFCVSVTADEHKTLKQHGFKIKNQKER